MPVSQIIIKDLKFYGFHGVYPEEQVVGTTFRVDMIVGVEPNLAGCETDRLEDTLNYEQIVEKILQIGAGRKFRLIERLAQSLCESVLELREVLDVDVTVYKSVTRLTPEPQWIGIRRRMERQADAENSSHQDGRF